MKNWWCTAGTRVLRKLNNGLVVVRHSSAKSRKSLHWIGVTDKNQWICWNVTESHLYMHISIVLIYLEQRARPTVINYLLWVKLFSRSILALVLMHIHLMFTPFDCGLMTCYSARSIWLEIAYHTHSHPLSLSLSLFFSLALSLTLSTSKIRLLLAFAFIRFHTF